MKFNTNLFEGVAKKNVKKSFQDLTYEWKHDFQPGSQIPFLWLPTLPGDEIDIKCSFMFKFDPLYYPIIHRMIFHADLFYVPNRIMWPAVVGDKQTGWTNWIMLQNEVLHPTVDVDMRYNSLSLEDNDSVMGYLGIPYLLRGDGDVGIRNDVITGLNAFPPMAYLHIRDQYYRNTQLEDARAFPLVAGDNTAAMVAAYGLLTPTNVNLAVLPAYWEKDYFTSMLPQPQLGDAVQIPMFKTWTEAGSEYNGPFRLREADTHLPAADSDLLINDATGGIPGQMQGGIGGPAVYLDTQETAADIRQFTLASVVQGFRETLMRIRQTYRDYVKHIFDEDPTPLVVDVPVLFGSYNGVVMVSDSFTQATIDPNVDATMAGNIYGNMSMFDMSNQSHKYKCSEHGIIMGIMSLVPNTGYGQGINRYWRYSTPYDYPMDIFSSVGDQAVLNEELYYTNFIAELAKNQRTLGYIPKYSEARTMPNNYGTNLGTPSQGVGLSQHMGRWFSPVDMDGADYDDAIELDEFFVMSMNQNVIGGLFPGGIRTSHLWRALTLPNGAASSVICTGYVLNEIGALRPLPMFSTPGLGD